MTDFENKLMDIMLPHWRLDKPYTPLPTTIKQNLDKVMKIVKLLKENKK